MIGFLDNIKFEANRIRKTVLVIDDEEHISRSNFLIFTLKSEDEIMLAK